MKRNLLLLATFILLFQSQTSFAQWQSNGPDGGSMLSLANLNSYTFTGTSNGVFSTTDNGLTWTAANTGIQRKSITSLAALGNNIFAGTSFNGVYMSANNGATWTQSNTGLLDTIIIALFSTGNGIYASTSTGVYYSMNGQNWTLANNGIPSTYPIYSYTSYDSIVYGGTYGFGLYSTADSGSNWTPVNGGFPPNSYVYALISDGDSILFAGTSDGVYKSTDGGASWSQSNSGFPSGMWAHSFAMANGYVYAGTYNSGVLVTTITGLAWTPMNNGIPDLPLATGLSTNYPSVQAMISSGSNVLAASNFGMYMTEDSASSWQEANKGILATIVTSINANDSIVIAGTSGTGVYISMDAGNSWQRQVNGLTSEYVIAVSATKTWAFASVENTKVFRSNNNGSLWNTASNGLQASVKSFRPDSLRVVALTQGQQFTPPALYETVDNGLNWTTITDPGVNYLTALGITNHYIYVAADTQVFVTSTNGNSWQPVGSNLPSTTINAVLPVDTNTVFIGTETNGVYKWTNTSNWTAMNSGITNLEITDIRMQAGVLYVSTWGGGVFYSLNMGSTWIPYNVGLDNLYVSALASDSLRLYAATDAGVYSEVVIINSIKQPIYSSVQIFPNPTGGKLYISNLSNEKTQIRVLNSIGEFIYEYDGYPSDNLFVDLSNHSSGIYFLVLQNQKETSVQKIILQE